MTSPPPLSHRLITGSGSIPDCPVSSTLSTPDTPASATWYPVLNDSLTPSSTVSSPSSVDSATSLTTAIAPGIIAIIGINGTQGRCVAEKFLTQPRWKVRGVMRDVDNPKAADWVARGVEVVHGNLDGSSDLSTALQGAKVVFAMTDFWQHMRCKDAVAQAARENKSLAEICHDREVVQGKTLADAVEKVQGLEHFVLSTLGDAKGWSKGKFTGVYNFDSKWASVEYIKNLHPDLWGKTSLIQLGSFMENYKKLITPLPDGTFVIGCTLSPTIQTPWVDPGSDMGKIVFSIVAGGRKVNVAGHAQLVSYTEICEAFTRVSGKTIRYEHVDVDSLEKLIPNGGVMLAEMFEYFEECGYYGGDEVQTPDTLEIPVEMTTYEEYFQKELEGYFRGLEIQPEQAETVVRGSMLPPFAFQSQVGA